MNDEPEPQAAPLTVLEALRLIWQADSYPILGNEDWKEAARMDQRALDRAKGAVSCPGDPPGFRHWLTAMLSPDISREDREEAMWHLHVLFDPEYPW